MRERRTRPQQLLLLHDGALRLTCLGEGWRGDSSLAVSCWSGAVARAPVSPLPLAGTSERMRCLGGCGVVGVVCVVCWVSWTSKPWLRYASKSSVMENAGGILATRKPHLDRIISSRAEAIA